MTASMSAADRLAGVRSWIFDCDGVLLDSNAVKTDAFRLAAAPYGDRAAEALVRYHRRTGGVSRHEKARYFFDEILQQPVSIEELDRFVGCFANAVVGGLADVVEDAAARALLDHVHDQGCAVFVVTGGDEDEVRSEFDRRGLAHYFTGVYGSPTGKREIIQALLDSGAIRAPVAIVGDGALDAASAVECGFDFVFVSHWTEWDGWEHALPPASIVVEDLAALLDLLEQRAR